MMKSDTTTREYYMFFLLYMKSFHQIEMTTLDFLSKNRNGSTPRERIQSKTTVYVTTQGILFLWWPFLEENFSWSSFLDVCFAFTHHLVHLSDGPRPIHGPVISNEEKDFDGHV
jgi:hypothetical protein